MVETAARPAPVAALDAARSRLPSLTGLRWVGAMLVFGFHIGTMGVMSDPTPKAIVSRVFGMGLSGVQFFYILSGFVLVWSYRDGEKRWTFYRRRMAKIFPNHVVLWLAVILLVGLWWGDPIKPGAAVLNLFLLQAWHPGMGWFYSVNTVSWSLSCELFFYICLPLVLPLIRRMPVRALQAVMFLLPFVMLIAIYPGQLLVPEPARWWFTQVFPVVRSLEFWLGVVVAELAMRRRWNGPNLPVALGVFVAAWVVCTYGWAPAEMWPAVLATAYIVVIAAAADADIRDLWSPFRTRPLVWLGEVSFAFYMVHVFVVTSTLRALERMDGFGGWAGPAAAVALTGMCLGSAALLFRYVETPMMRVLGPPRRSRSAARTPAQASVPAQVPAQASVPARASAQAQVPAHVPRR
jgi:peptidoglycan/LPS O-acetylase OafA/YrhL